MSGPVNQNKQKLIIVYVHVSRISSLDLKFHNMVPNLVQYFSKLDQMKCPNHSVITWQLLPCDSSSVNLTISPQQELPLQRTSLMSPLGQLFPCALFRFVLLWYVALVP